MIMIGATIIPTLTSSELPATAGVAAEDVLVVSINIVEVAIVKSLVGGMLVATVVEVVAIELLAEVDILIVAAAAMEVVVANETYIHSYANTLANYH